MIEDRVPINVEGISNRPQCILSIGQGGGCRIVVDPVLDAISLLGSRAGHADDRRRDRVLGTVRPAEAAPVICQHRRLPRIADESILAADEESDRFDLPQDQRQVRNGVSGFVNRNDAPLDSLPGLIIGSPRWRF